MSILIQQNYSQPDLANENFNQWNEDSIINKKFSIKPNFISLWQNERLEKYNTIKYVDFSYSSFFQTMNEVKNNEIENYPDDFYKIMGIPAPDQYRAFIKLYELVDNDDFFAKHPKTLSNHARLPRYPGTLKLLRDIYNNYNTDPVKNIKISCGSFYRKYLWVRLEIINYLNMLCKMGVKIEIYTNCKETEEKVNTLDKNIYFEHIKNRILIHFVLVDDKNIKLYYPHSEKVYHRLGMLLTSDDFNNELSEKKQELFRFFNELITEAKNKN